ncbi:MAG: MotA/TolQ/ExbB proton channel family protein, partial [Planctomycetota bacterium]|nr:MotA/TolQ/ExbB proton channel family protein [Planctomycetota bacterium]
MPDRFASRPLTVDDRRGVLGPVMSSLGWPIAIGLVAYWGFLLSLQQGWIASELLMRYLSAHPVSYVATAMFFVGVTSLLMKLLSVIYQINDRRNVKLSAAPSLAQRADSSRHLLEELQEMPRRRRGSYLGRRLRKALEFVHVTQTANGLEDELKYLAELDMEKQQESFALNRILIWAIPMLGFLGTVIGISGALGSLSVEADFNTMLTGLKQKLYVAFDTTALALTLSIGMMFGQFVVNRIEIQLLQTVDEAASAELMGRFVTLGTNRDPYLASVQSMSEKVLASISEIGSQQSAVWDRGLSSIEKTTESTLGNFAEVLADRLAQQLNPVMDEFGMSLRTAINDTSSFMEQHAKELGDLVQRSTELMNERNEELCHRFSEVSGDVKNAMGTHAEGLQQVLAESDQVLGARLQRFHQVMEQAFDTQSETLEKGVADSEKLLSHYSQQISQMMKQTVKLVEVQSEQLADGIENSRKCLQANTITLKQSVESANQVMDRHSEHLEDAVMAASQALGDHVKTIAEAVTESEEIVDKRQETIAKTQESMLKAQTQQTMAIATFNEKLQILEGVIEQ